MRLQGFADALKGNKLLPILINLAGLYEALLQRTPLDWLKLGCYVGEPCFIEIGF